MKKVLNIKNTIALMALLVAFVGFISMDKVRAYDPAGDWTYEIETPDGAVSGAMTIKKEADGYAVEMETDDFGTLELEDVEVDAKDKTAEMTGSVEVQGITAEFEVEFEDDEMTGVVLYGGEELPIVAERDN